jgi:LPS sulfotransferase NodH
VRASTSFVVLSTQRSGSTWVVDMLDSHPRVSCYGELLLPEGTGRHPVGAQDTVPLSDVLRERRRGWLARHLEGWRYLDRLYRGPAESIGFKLMYAQVRTFPWLPVYLALRRVRVVHVVRHNKFDQVLSRIVARETNQYHVLPGEEVIEARVRVDVDELLRQMEWERRKVERFRHLLSLLTVPTLEVSYESLVSDERGFDSLLNFVGVAPEGALVSRLTRLGSRSYEERIENYDEVRKALGARGAVDRI